MGGRVEEEEDKAERHALELLIVSGQNIHFVGVRMIGGGNKGGDGRLVKVK